MTRGNFSQAEIGRAARAEEKLIPKCGTFNFGRECAPALIKRRARAALHECWTRGLHFDSHHSTPCAPSCRSRRNDERDTIKSDDATATTPATNAEGKLLKSTLRLICVFAAQPSESKS